MKYLLILLFLPSCVTIKMYCKCVETHKPQNGTVLTPMDFMPNNSFLPYNSVRQDDGSFTCPLVKIVDNSEIPDWLKNCDTTFKN